VETFQAGTVKDIGRCRQFFDMMCSARHCVAFTGAGVSAPSGLPCFRDGQGGPSPQGETAAEIEHMVRGFFGPGDEPSWEELFSIETFERDPALFYEKAGPLLYHTRKPSVVHEVLADLEKQGVVKAVITQNVDMLHQSAGSARVIELHGSPVFHYCLRCAGIRMPFAAVKAIVSAKIPAAEKTSAETSMPLCPSCGRPLKPAVTLYGEPLPMEARREAEAEAGAADLMLVLGTSLAVYPAADIPRTVLRRGGRIVIVNRQDTILDDAAALRFRDLEDVFSALRGGAF
jgi:NAD-dependent deacetylase